MWDERPESPGRRRRRRRGRLRISRSASWAREWRASPRYPNVMRESATPERGESLGTCLLDMYLSSATAWSSSSDMPVPSSATVTENLAMSTHTRILLLSASCARQTPPHAQTHVGPPPHTMQTWFGFVISKEEPRGAMRSLCVTGATKAASHNTQHHDCVSHQSVFDQFLHHGREVDHELQGPDPLGLVRGHAPDHRRLALHRGAREEGEAVRNFPGGRAMNNTSDQKGQFVHTKGDLGSREGGRILTRIGSARDPWPFPAAVPRSARALRPGLATATTPMSSAASTPPPARESSGAPLSFQGVCVCTAQANTAGCLCPST